MERKRRQKRYRRLDRAERAAIQNGLERGGSCRRMARELGRSPSTVADEVARNRTVAKGPGKGERVRDVPDDACPKLLSWPRCCNSCRNLRYRCCRRWRREYSAVRAQALADAELRESRIGVDRDEAGFEYAMGLIRCDVARGLSPQQIALARAGQVGASPSTICWRYCKNNQCRVLRYQIHATASARCLPWPPWTSAGASSTWARSRSRSRPPCA